MPDPIPELPGGHRPEELPSTKSPENKTQNTTRGVVSSIFEQLARLPGALLRWADAHIFNRGSAKENNKIMAALAHQRLHLLTPELSKENPAMSNEEQEAIRKYKDNLEFAFEGYISGHVETERRVLPKVQTAVANVLNGMIRLKRKQESEAARQEGFVLRDEIKLLDATVDLAIAQKILSDVSKADRQDIRWSYFPKSQFPLCRQALSADKVLSNLEEKYPWMASVITNFKQSFPVDLWSSKEALDLFQTCLRSVLKDKKMYSWDDETATRTIGAVLDKTLASKIFPRLVFDQVKAVDLQIDQLAFPSCKSYCVWKRNPYAQLRPEG